MAGTIKNNKLELNHICKVEGHASLKINIEKGKVKECLLEAEEGARFFEAIVLNKDVSDVQEIVSRICGICSSSHSVCSLMALEKACGIIIHKKKRIERDLLLIGERIRSHATHLYFLTLPDFLGVSALNLTKKYNERVKDALSLIKFGNFIVEVFGGREIHPFQETSYQEKQIKKIKEEIDKIIKIAERTLALFLSLKYPVFERNTEWLCLKEKNGYALSSGVIASSTQKINTDDYSKHLKENIKEYATSKFVLFDNIPYQTGAMIRVNSNYQQIDEGIKKIIEEHNIKIPMRNPFYNNVAQAIEILYYSKNIKEMIDELKGLKEEKEEKMEFKEGRAVAAVEAPRGTLFHEYEIKEGKIKYCNIITPTAQNLNQMELDIKEYINQLIKRKKIKKEAIIIEIEKLIRAYDPCFSCSTHFLKVDWKET